MSSSKISFSFYVLFQIIHERLTGKKHRGRKGKEEKKENVKEGEKEKERGIGSLGKQKGRNPGIGSQDANVKSDEWKEDDGLNLFLS